MQTTTFEGIETETLATGTAEAWVEPPVAYWDTYNQPARSRVLESGWRFTNRAIRAACTRAGSPLEPLKGDYLDFYMGCHRFLQSYAAVRATPATPTWTGVRPETWLWLAYQRLAHFAELDADWDSYGAMPIAERAVSTAERFLMSVRDELSDSLGERIRPHSVAPLPDGGVQMEWRAPAGAFELEISPGGDFGCLLVHEGESGQTHEERENVTFRDALDLVALTFVP